MTAWTLTMELDWGLLFWAVYGFIAWMIGTFCWRWWNGSGNSILRYPRTAQTTAVVLGVLWPLFLIYSLSLFILGKDKT